MEKYDYFVAGRWRNHDAVKEVVDILRANGKKVYCFIENPYKGESVEFDKAENAEANMQNLESLSLDDPFIGKVFRADVNAESNSDAFVLVLPAGISGHIEAGIAYGMGKRCYAVGQPEKTETLYRVFHKIFPDIQALDEWLKQPPKFTIH